MVCKNKDVDYIIICGLDYTELQATGMVPYQRTTKRTYINDKRRLFKSSQFVITLSLAILQYKTQ